MPEEEYLKKVKAIPRNELTDTDKIQYWKDLYLKKVQEIEELSKDYFQVCLFKDLLIDDNVKKAQIIKSQENIINMLENKLQSLQLQVSRAVNK